MLEILHRYTKASLYKSEDAKTLRGADLGGADLGGANLGGANLGGADLGGADLRGADLRDAYLRDADLRGAYLRDADLRGANLRDADLRGANLRGADLGGADLRGADLRGANLRDADLRGAKIHSGVAATCLGSGDGTRYPWRAWLMRGGSLVLSLGCIERPLGWWRSAAGAKVCADEHGDAARLSALLTWVEALAAARRQGG